MGSEESGRVRGHRTAKERSQTQERDMARLYDGVASVSSGAAPADQGDVRAELLLGEAKHRGSFEKPVASISISAKTWLKIWNEAVSEGREPVMFLRMYVERDSHPLTWDGYIDLTVRDAEMDAYHMELVRQHAATA